MCTLLELSAYICVCSNGWRLAHKFLYIITYVICDMMKRNEMLAFACCTQAAKASESGTYLLKHTHHDVINEQ